MADGQHGGYRQPARPAAVSGPGALSQRTDGSPGEMVASDGSYGDRKDMQSIQSGATMMPPGPTRASLPGLADPTARPQEDVRAGMNTIPNIAPSQMGDNTREKAIAALPVLAWLASQSKASEQTRQFFRQLRGDL